MVSGAKRHVGLMLMLTGLLHVIYGLLHTQVNYNPSSLKACGVQWQMISGIVEPRSGSRCLDFC